MLRMRTSLLGLRAPSPCKHRPSLLRQSAPHSPSSNGHYNSNSIPVSTSSSIPGEQSPNETPSTPAPVYDEKLADAWKAPEGERPLWFVEKFEARRKAEAAGASTSPQAPEPAPEHENEEKDQAPEPTEKTQEKPNPTSNIFVALQLLQLVVVVGLLILAPASLQADGLLSFKVWVMYLAYLYFFAQGSINRIIKYGQLAKRSEDKQLSTWGSRIAFVFFIMAVPLLHWYAVIRYIFWKPFYGLSLYDVIGSACIVGAILLNRAASDALGKAYDRVVAPEKLVTSGPYRFVQHPIYSSYMLLFFGFAMFLHSAPIAVLMVLVCVMYYRQRVSLEQQVLHGAFGGTYLDYLQKTKKYIPFVW